MLWGLDLTHLDSHMGTLQMRPEFFDIYLDLAIEFQLPIRLSGASTERLAGFPFRSLAAAESVLFPDYFVYAMGVGSRDTVMTVARDLRPGVTELYVHPATDSPELRGVTALARGITRRQALFGPEPASDAALLLKWRWACCPCSTLVRLGLCHRRPDLGCMGGVGLDDQCCGKAPSGLVEVYE